MNRTELRSLGHFQIWTKIVYLRLCRNLRNHFVFIYCKIAKVSLPWIRGPRAKKAARRTSERSGRSGTSRRMKSKPRSDELSPSHQSDTCSCSAQSQMNLWPYHTSKQQVWQHNNCTVGLDALLYNWMEINSFNNQIIQ